MGVRRRSKKNQGRSPVHYYSALFAALKEVTDDLHPVKLMSLWRYFYHHWRKKCERFLNILSLVRFFLEWFAHRVRGLLASLLFVDRTLILVWSLHGVFFALSYVGLLCSKYILCEHSDNLCSWNHVDVSKRVLKSSELSRHRVGTSQQ